MSRDITKQARPRALLAEVLASALALGRPAIGRAEDGCRADPPGPAAGGAAAGVRVILDTAAVEGGLVVHLGCGTGELTAALRASEGFVVHGLDADAGGVAAARETIGKLGLYGPVAVEHWTGKHLPYADNLVNLLVVERAGGIPREEMLRVLAPRGVLMVAGADGPAAARRSEAGGEKIVKPWPAGIDEWTHYLHDASNNAVSKDTRVAPPRRLQWQAGPRWGRSHDHLAGVSAAVAAGGRLFAVVDEGPIAAVKAPARWMLIARDAFSGVRLWGKPVGPWEDHLRPFRSGPAGLPRRLAAVGGRVYVTLGYGRPVAALDAATGEVARTYEGTENTHEIVVCGGRLFLVVSEPLAKPSGTTGTVVRRGAVWRGAYPECVTRYMPRRIVVLECETGKRIWEKRDAEATDILPLTLIVHDGRAFYQNADHVVALKAETGTVLWRAKRPVARNRYAWAAPTLVASGQVVLSADRAPQKPVEFDGADPDRLEWLVSANHILTGGELIAFSAETGTRLWTAPCHEGFNAPPDVFVIDGKVYTSVLAWPKMPGITNVYDLYTGKVVETRKPDRQTYGKGFGHHRCYRNKATGRYIIQGRRGVEFIDLASDRVTADYWVRGACQYGILPANGLVYAPTHPCACYVTVMLEGFNALSGAGPAAPREEPDRLEKGPAWKQVPGPGSQVTEAGAWCTYRHDTARTGATPTALPPKLAVGWQRRLGGPLTAVVAAEGKVYVARKDAHTVHALRADNGEPVWQYAAGGRVDSPPTISQGRVYFGSADGWVYCLRAGDGALAWRFRVAGSSRRIVCCEQVESAWPVHGSVLVCPGPGGRPTVYAAAGRSSAVDGGLRFCGLDATTGGLLVSRRISDGEARQPGSRQRSTGAKPDVLAADGGSIFMRHARLDLEGRPLSQTVAHLYSPAGFLDDTWWHRTYWQIGTDMGSGYGGWWQVGNRRISGRILVRKGGRVFGYGRNSYGQTGGHPGIQSEYHLFAADLDARRASARPGKGGKSAPGGKSRYVWSRALPFHVRAMVLAGDVLFIAGPDDEADFHEARPGKGARLWAVAAADGKTLAEHSLAASPVFDSFAVCGARLFFSTVDGRLVCRTGG